MRISLALLFFLFAGIKSNAQNSSSEVLHQLKQLSNPTTIMYIAAHPDDENTRFISWLVNDQYCQTAYLSLTRGDGGQNLIGQELGSELGVLRTQELMQARKIDGGEQFFTRAVDFGYSKNADETFEKWGKNEVLSDVVWQIRKLRPSVIITRFPPDARGGHGHHTASAILALEAYDLAADPTAYPEQLEFVDPWQVERVYWNTSTWWGWNLDSLMQTDPAYSKYDVGAYNPTLGVSTNELASYSRTQHKSQGFGVNVGRGSVNEYLYLLKGDTLSLFEELPKTWKAYGLAKADKTLESLIKNYSAEGLTKKQIMSLLELRAGADNITDPQKKIYFIKKIDHIVSRSLGVYLELLAKNEYDAISSEIEIDLKAIVRSFDGLNIEKLILENQTIALNKAMPLNDDFKESFKIKIGQNYSQAYWLKEDYTNMFVVNSQRLIGISEFGFDQKAEVVFSIDGQEFTVKKALQYKEVDRVKGEIYKPHSISPELLVETEVENLFFLDNSLQKTTVKLINTSGFDRMVELKAGNWEIKPNKLFLAANTELDTLIEIAPSEKRERAKLIISSKSKEVLGLTQIDYDHINKRNIYKSRAIQLIPLDFKKKGDKIAYIMGAGDKVPEALKLMGYEVDIIDETFIRSNSLNEYQAVIAGIRAYNTEKWLPEVKEELMKYVFDGGNYIVQYNTKSRDLLSDNIGPKPFKISRLRVTDEESDVVFKNKEHAYLNTPNQISMSDFDGWVQERGLYFCSEWDSDYQTVLAWSDKGEENLEGGLIQMDYGKGSFAYTGISFFRELPAGVEGAYKLLANMISYEQD